MTISQETRSTRSILIDLESNNPSQQAQAIIEVIEPEITVAIPVII